MSTVASKKKGLSANQLLERLRPYQREIIGGALLLMALITLLSLLSLTGGTLSQWWATVFAKLFGWGAIPATLLLAVFGAMLLLGRLKDEFEALPHDIIIGVELLFVAVLSLVHLLAEAPGEYAVRLAREGGGGGFVGWGISNFMVELVGQTAAIILLMLLGLVGLAILFRLTPADAAAWAELVRGWMRRRNPDDDELASPSPAVLDVPALPPPAQELQKTQVDAQPRSTPRAASPRSKKSDTAVMPGTTRKMPPIELLTPPAKDPTQGANARYQAQIIEETLQGFGIPAEVVEINAGPTVTQFGLKLGTLERKLPDGTITQQRVRVNKIAALNNDLALALSAAPIRIETPVPGRPLVGIEVPNSDKTMVSLRAIIEDKGFQKSRKPLLVALGKDVSGQPTMAAVVDMPHLLIAGATGSGKSVCVNALICALLMTHAPEQLKFLMIDPKMVELTSFNGIPHLIAPVVTDFEQVVGALSWVTREMERRYKLFAKAGARSLNGYNRKVAGKDERLPFLVVVIDELADLMMMAPDEVERNIARIAQMARATGIHLIIATQRPSVDVVTGLIKANFPTRIAFAVSSQIDSRVILDTTGAEKLLGSGDMLYMASNSPKLARLQGCFVADTEINNLVSFWKTSYTGSGVAPQPEKVADEDLPWADILAQADKDDLLEEAIKLVIDSDRASTSLLQRRLGIGYPRASRLMDQLEEEGVVGPAEGTKPRDVLWQDGPGDDYDEFEQDVDGG